MLKRAAALRAKEPPRGLFCRTLAFAWLGVNILLDLLDLLFAAI